jgi:putative thioredoxin
MDISAADFEAEVVQASKQVPVIVDFWAPWCAPCRALKPILEKLAAEYRGRFKLVKVNSDQEPELAAAFGVRSIPDVIAFKDGQAVSHFLGALPERQVRAFIESLLPSPAEIERARARELKAAGDTAGALAALERALALDPANGLARLDLVQALIELARLDEAERALDALKPNIDWDERAETLRQSLSFARAGHGASGDAELQARLAANPADHEARLALAGLRAAKRRYREALDELLEIIRRDKGWKDGEAKKQVLAIFNLAGDEPELVSEYRRKLARVLY